MVDVADAQSLSVPERAEYHSSARRLEVVVDVFPADPADLTVAAGPRRLRIVAEHAGETYERVLSPPDRERRFTEDRRAVYNNGVLTVSVGMAPRTD